MKILEGNILNAKNCYICHQVNCQGIMGGGLARQIKEFDPYVEKEYIAFTEEKFGNLLGEIQIVPSKNNIEFVNMFAQDKCGSSEKYTDYEAFEKCLIKMTKRLNKNTNIYFPYKIGCGLGGGDWDIIFSLIEKYFPESILVKYNG